MRAHYEGTSSGRLFGIGHRTGFTRKVVRAIVFIKNINPLLSNYMLAIRLYISALTFGFLFLVIAHRGLGILEAVIVTCSLVYLILDVRAELQIVKSDFRQLEELEQHVSLLRRRHPTL